MSATTKLNKVKYSNFKDRYKKAMWKYETKKSQEANLTDRIQKLKQ